MTNIWLQIKAIKGKKSKSKNMNYKERNYDTLLMDQLVSLRSVTFPTCDTVVLYYHRQFV